MSSTTRPLPLARLLAALALGALGCGALSGSETARDPQEIEVAATAADSARDALFRRADAGRIEGNPRSDVWLIVLSDFQCPYCKVWHDETGPLIDSAYVRTGKIRIAYLNLPISTHRNARPAHEAAMCAAEQGKFWPVADALFATQRLWKGVADAPAWFDSLTATLDVDRARLRACVASGGLRPLIQADLDRATRIGVGSTPTFFVGSQAIVGAQPFEVFRRALDQAIAKAKPAG